MNKKLIAPIVTAGAMLVTSIGSTFALFTSKASSRIDIEAGKVQVEMESELLWAKSRYADEVPYDAVAAAEGKDDEAIFENNGVINIETSDGTSIFSVDRFAPMDQFAVKLHANNLSNIDTKYRININASGQLLPGIKIEIDGEDFSCRTDSAVLYGSWSDVITPEVTYLFSKEVVVTFEDREDNNDFQEKSCTLEFEVEMIQGNAAVENPNGAARIGMNKFETLEEAVTYARKGDTITVMNDIDLTSYPYGEYALIDLTDKVLDLDGHAISSNNFGVIYDGYNFTIKNGKFVSVDKRYSIFIGDGGCDFDLNQGIILEDLELFGGINIFASNKVTLRNVVSSTDPESMWYAVFGDEGADIVIESGTYSSTSTSGHVLLDNVGIDDDSYMLVKGGTFIAPEGVGLARESMNLVIEGGSFNLDPSAWVNLEAFDVVLNDGMYTVSAK